MWRGICQLNRLLPPVTLVRDLCVFFPSQQETEVGRLSVSATKTKIKCTVLKKELCYY